MERFPTNEPQENPERTDSSTMKNIKRRIGNRLLLGLALGAGLLGAGGASAEGAGNRLKEAAQSTRMAISEKVGEVDKHAQELHAAEDTFVKLTKQLESIRETEGLTTHLVGYSAKKSWHPAGSPTVTFRMGKILSFEHYTASPGTSDAVRSLITQHDAATERFANLQLSLGQ